MENGERNYLRWANFLIRIISYFRDGSTRRRKNVQEFGRLLRILADRAAHESHSTHRASKARYEIAVEAGTP